MVTPQSLFHNLVVFRAGDVVFFTVPLPVPARLNAPGNIHQQRQPYDDGATEQKNQNLYICHRFTPPHQPFIPHIIPPVNTVPFPPGESVNVVWGTHRQHMRKSVLHRLPGPHFFLCELAGNHNPIVLAAPTLLFSIKRPHWAPQNL